MYYCNKCGHMGEEGPVHHKRGPLGTVMELCHYDAVKSKHGMELSVQEVANTVAQFLPPSYALRLCIENGSAWVELANQNHASIPLPDTADKTLYQQINDAMCVACGWPA